MTGVADDLGSLELLLALPDARFDDKEDVRTILMINYALQRRARNSKEKMGVEVVEGGK